jgi:hypothetical protein
MRPNQNAANGVVKIKLNSCNETMECTIHSTIRTTAEHAHRRKAADNMGGDEQ